jgi:hypothetical protein
MWLIILLVIIVIVVLLLVVPGLLKPTDHDAEIRSNANTELNKLIYKFALEKKTDAQIIADTTVSELVRLSYKGTDLGGLTMADLVTPLTISSTKKSASYFMTNMVLAKRMKTLLAKNYDDKKIASEFCRLEGLQVQNTDLSYLQDDYHAWDITRLRVDPHFIHLINSIK